MNARTFTLANITLHGRDRTMGHLPPTEYHIEGCSQAAASIIERYHDQPFFLYVAYRAPRTSWGSPQREDAHLPAGAAEFVEIELKAGSH